MQNKKVALVTGSAGHLGSAVVERFAESGYHVIGTVRPGDVPDEKQKVEYRELDLLNADGCKSLAGDLIGRHGRIDAAVFCAGGFSMESVETMKWGDVVRMRKLNFETAFHLSSAVLQAVMASDGACSMVFIGGKPAMDPDLGQAMAPYALAKGQLILWSRLLAAAGADKNIRSHVVIPGTIDTPDNRSSMPDADRSNWMTAGTLANNIYYLCSEAAKQITTDVIELYGRA